MKISLQWTGEENRVLLGILMRTSKALSSDCRTFLVAWLSGASGVY